MKKIFVAIPCLDYINKNFVQSLMAMHRPKGYELMTVFSESSLVHLARNRLIEQAITTDCEYILWLDSDMVFKPNLLDMLLKSIEGKEFVCGLYFARRPPFAPAIFKSFKISLFNGAEIEKYTDYPRNQLFRIEACGFACVLMTTELARDVWKKYPNPFLFYQNGLVGEDITFCAKAIQCGHELYCDSRIKIGHVTQTVVNEESYEVSKNVKQSKTGTPNIDN